MGEIDSEECNLFPSYPRIKGRLLVTLLALLMLCKWWWKWWHGHLSSGTCGACTVVGFHDSRDCLQVIITKENTSAAVVVRWLSFSEFNAL